MGSEFTVVGPQVRLPGSDQLMFGVGVVLLAVGLVALAVVMLVRARRRRRGAPRRPPVAIGVVSVLALIGGALAVANRPLPFFVPEFPALPRLLPQQAFFYRTVTDLPVSADSARAVASLTGPDGTPFALVPGMSGVVVDGVAWGMPFNPVDDATPRVAVKMRRSPSPSFTGSYPMADPAYIQSLPSYGIDNHYIAVDATARRMWELIAASRWFGRWEADAGALWNLDELTYPRSSTTASGLPLLPGTITYPEVAAGRVQHAVLMAAGVTSPGAAVWPARGTDGRSTDPDAPRMGSWFRLRADVPIDDLPIQARVIAQGLKDYGMVLGDTGGTMAITGTVDRRWDDDQLRALNRITAHDFDVVDGSGVMVSPDSMEARPAG